MDHHRMDIHGVEAPLCLEGGMIPQSNYRWLSTIETVTLRNWRELMRRIIIATLLGGLIVFVWSAISHMMLPLGSMGMNMEKLPGEAAFLTDMKDTIPESGMYFLPGMDTSITDVQAQWDDAAKRMEAGPVAFLVVQRDGAPAMDPMQLLYEFITNVIAALIAAVLIANVAGSYFKRILLITSLGLFAWMTVETSQLIWYGFPPEYMLAQGIDHLVGWFLAGILIAGIVKSRNTPTPQAVHAEVEK